MRWLVLAVTFFLSAVGAATAAERAAGFNGTTYTPIAPLYTGQSNNLSYLRFPNFGSTAVTTDITAVGVTTGRLYGIAGLTVFPHASPQYAIAQILTAANASTTVDNEGVALYLRADSAGAAYQHVIYNSASGFFENVTNCFYVDGKNYHFLNQGVMNVHTTALPSYPAVITVHNLADSTAAIALDVYLASNGTALGSYPVSITANGTATISMDTIEHAIGWAPGATDYHVNLMSRAASPGGVVTIQIGQLIRNAALATDVSLSTVCPINN